MGWKGVVRSMKAASRAAERDAKRRKRQLEVQSKQYAKMEALEQAAYEYDVYLNHIELLKSVHKESSEPIDWIATGKLPKPTEPVLKNMNEKIAQERFDSYKPSFLDRTLKRVDRIKNELRQAISVERDKDNQIYRDSIAQWKSEVNDWQRNCSLAEGVYLGFAEQRVDVLKGFDPFSEISALGSSIEFNAQDGKALSVVLKVHSKDVLPSQKCSLLQSGKVSKKSFSVSEFNELHQDYVCSCVLRVAREVFSMLPDQMVVVTAVDQILNKKTGHMEELPILSAAISRATLDKLNIDLIDPSDSMQNFVHNMSFKKTTGFQSVEKLDENLFELLSK